MKTVRWPWIECRNIENKSQVVMDEASTRDCQDDHRMEADTKLLGFAVSPLFEVEK